MSVLIVHPDDSPIDDSPINDSPISGPWSRERWDFILDIGWAGKQTYARWEQQAGCPVRGFYSYAEGPADFLRIAETLKSARGFLVDGAGLDWWEILAPLQVMEMLQLALAKRVLGELGSAELVGTRPHPVAALLSRLSGRAIRYWREGDPGGWSGHLQRLQTAVSVLSPPQLLQAGLDKWDAAYRFRGRFSLPGSARTKGALLLPSSYANVTRVLNAYAQLIPEQQCLLVTTRMGGNMAGLAPNVLTKSLAGFAEFRMKESTRKELRGLERDWTRLQAGPLHDQEDLAWAARMGWFQSIGTSLERWLRLRDAWGSVLDREQIGSVLCGDENNATNRIPVLLAAQRRLPTVHCDHGALNVLLPLRSPACDTYLVKGEMERDYMARSAFLGPSFLGPSRMVVGAPFSFETPAQPERTPDSRRIVFFSEQLELTFGRTRILYEQLLPRLCELARRHGRRVVVKLHPFESLARRSALLTAVLCAQDRVLVDLAHGPLSEDLLRKTWFALTVESSVSVDCAIRGIPCFLCRWFATPLTGYDQQLVRHGAAQSLETPEDVMRIPEMLEGFVVTPEVRRGLWSPLPPGKLRTLLRIS